MAEPRTLLAALIEKLHGCNVHGDTDIPPVAVIWTDPRSEWKPLIPQLRQQLPELLCLGDYAPEQGQGPALWLRCIVDGSLPAAEGATDRIPVIYLPGVSRQDLRAGEGCPWVLEPLIELLFRGSLWLQRNGRDWTLPAFLSSGDGLDLDLASDQSTKNRGGEGEQPLFLRQAGHHLTAADFQATFNGVQRIEDRRILSMVAHVVLVAETGLQLHPVGARHQGEEGITHVEVQQVAATFIGDEQQAALIEAPEVLHRETRCAVVLRQHAQLPAAHMFKIIEFRLQGAALGVGEDLRQINHRSGMVRQEIRVVVGQCR